MIIKKKNISGINKEIIIISSSHNRHLSMSPPLIRIFTRVNYKLIRIYIYIYFEIFLPCSTLSDTYTSFIYPPLLPSRYG